MKRATEEHVVKGKSGDALEGGPLTQFLLNIQEYDQVSAKMARRLRDPKLVELLAASELDKKADFADKKKLQELAKEIEKARLKIEPKLTFDEEHSLHELVLTNGLEAAVNWSLWLVICRVQADCALCIRPSRCSISRRSSPSLHLQRLG